MFVSGRVVANYHVEHFRVVLVSLNAGAGRLGLEAFRAHSEVVNLAIFFYNCAFPFRTRVDHWHTRTSQED